MDRSEYYEYLNGVGLLREGYLRLPVQQNCLL